jgi:exopolyphosphatase/guanosine-5'-triphosphate,3'-diphosphate pyrophosphatase
MQVKRGKLILKMPGSYRELASERLAGRLRQLARLIGREPIIEA